MKYFSDLRKQIADILASPSETVEESAERKQQWRGERDIPVMVEGQPSDPNQSKLPMLRAPGELNLDTKKDRPVPLSQDSSIFVTIKSTTLDSLSETPKPQKEIEEAKIFTKVEAKQPENESTESTSERSRRQVLENSPPSVENKEIQKIKDPSGISREQGLNENRHLDSNPETLIPALSRQKKRQSEIISAESTITTQTEVTSVATEAEVIKVVNEEVKPVNEEIKPSTEINIRKRRQINAGELYQKESGSTIEYTTEFVATPFRKRRQSQSALKEKTKKRRRRQQDMTEMRGMGDISKMLAGNRRVISTISGVDSRDPNNLNGDSAFSGGRQKRQINAGETSKTTDSTVLTTQNDTVVVIESVEVKKEPTTVIADIQSARTEPETKSSTEHSEEKAPERKRRQVSLGEVVKEEPILEIVTENVKKDDKPIEIVGREESAKSLGETNVKPEIVKVDPVTTEKIIQLKERRQIKDLVKDENPSSTEIKTSDEVKPVETEIKISENKSKENVEMQKSEQQTITSEPTIEIVRSEDKSIESKPVAREDFEPSDKRKRRQAIDTVNVTQSNDTKQEETTKFEEKANIANSDSSIAINKSSSEVSSESVNTTNQSVESNKPKNEEEIKPEPSAESRLLNIRSRRRRDAEADDEKKKDSEETIEKRMEEKNEKDSKTSEEISEEDSKRNKNMKTKTKPQSKEELNMKNIQDSKEGELFREKSDEHTKEKKKKGRSKHNQKNKNPKTSDYYKEMSKFEYAMEDESKEKICEEGDENCLAQRTEKNQKINTLEAISAMKKLLNQTANESQVIEISLKVSQYPVHQERHDASDEIKDELELTDMDSKPSKRHARDTDKWQKEKNKGKKKFTEEHSCTKCGKTHKTPEQ